MSDEKPEGVRIEARFVPFPKSISSQARQSLASRVGPDGVPLSMMAPPPAPDDLAGWAAAKAAASDQIMKVVGAMTAGLKSALETVELGGAIVHVATPPDLAASDRAYLDVHGGGLVHGAGEFCRAGARKNADLHGVRCYAVDYRMPPEHPYPAALDDCLAAYRALLGRYGPENVIVGGRNDGDVTQ